MIIFITYRLPYKSNVTEFSSRTLHISKNMPTSVSDSCSNPCSVSRAGNATTFRPQLRFKYELWSYLVKLLKLKRRCTVSNEMEWRRRRNLEPRIFAISITYLLTYLRNWALPEKPPIVQPLKNFLEFYETRRFIAVFIRALHWSLFWARSIQCTPSYLSKIYFNIVHSHFLVFLVVSFLLASPPISYMHSSPPPFDLLYHCF
jgi:hypothetical protein